MKSAYLPLVSLLLVVGCGKNLGDMLNMGKKPYTKHNTDPTFNTYIDNFEQEFKVNVSVPVIFKELDSNKAGVCYVWSDGYREIEINSKSWPNFSEEQKEQLIFHELGHCVFNLDHDDSRLEYKQECPNNIMRSYMFSQWEIDTCYIPENIHYMEVLDARK
jgi:hypothetical protein